MAAMMLMTINFIKAQKPILKFIVSNIITAISWLPPLILQLFHQDFLKATPFYTAWLFLHGTTIIPVLSVILPTEVSLPTLTRRLSLTTVKFI